MNEEKTETFLEQRRILITGVSGLIGRILFHHLSKTYPNKYYVVGTDQHLNMSPRYQLEHFSTLSKEQILSFPSDRFFQCDITDRVRLYQIIDQQKIEIIIHLAALLETNLNLDQIFHVNIQGTKNVFEAPGIHRVICASSVMTMFGYFQYEPYRSIWNDTFDDNTMLQNLQKLTVDDHPPLLDCRTEGIRAYCQSKIIGEQMANDVRSNDSTKSIISVRFGGVSLDDQPGTGWYRTVWFSHRDVCAFIDKALQAPAHISGTYFALSNNHRLWLDLEKTKTDLHFVPQDGAPPLS